MANSLTLARIFLVFPIALCLLVGWHWLAFWLFVIAGLTDLIDGALARALGDTSAFGTALDPIADKMLSAGTLVMLVHSDAIFSGHVLAALIIILREFFIGGLREVLAGKLDLPVSQAAKWKTAIQFIPLGLLLIPVDLLNILGLVCLWSAAALTVWTGFTYGKIGLDALARDQMKDAI